jgi:hypothetical protein
MWLILGLSSSIKFLLIYFALKSFSYSSPKPLTIMNDYLVNGRYRMKQLVGAGSFGAVYKAVDIQTKKLVAVKVE